jgi:hypothetical protein
VNQRPVPQKARESVATVAQPTGLSIPGPSPVPVGAIAAPGKTAIIVAHGMGQQVPFEALEELANSVARSAAESQGKAPLPTCRMVRLEDAQIPRVDLKLTGQDGREQEVHLYEIYWAPITERKVSLRDAVTFLLRSALGGLRLSLSGKFERWMFGRWISFRKRTVATTIQFLVGLWGVLAVVLMNATIVVIAVSRLLAGGSGRWSSDSLVADVTVSLALTEGLALLFLVAALWIPGAIGPTPERGSPRRGPILALRQGNRALVFALLGALIAALTLIPYLFGSTVAGRAQPIWTGWAHDWLAAALAAGASRHGYVALILAVLWVFAIMGSLAARWFFIQYIGDVAAYISAHTVNKFYSVRQEIRKAALQVAAAVFKARDEASQAFQYSRVILTGHSLGSVLAYDVLNRLILEDLTLGSPNRVRDRTKMLLTCGSPLDKTAYIFRSQRPRESEIREALAAAVQPMIVEYANRPDLWVNIWSPDDWISGSLEYYDDLAQTSAASRWVQNIEDPEALRPLAAHTEYFRNRAVGRALYSAATT